MDDLRTDRQKDLERLRKQQREDLELLRTIGLKPMLVGGADGVKYPTIAETALRRAARDQRDANVTRTIEAVEAYLDTQAALDVSMRIHGTSAHQSHVSHVESLMTQAQSPTPSVEMKDIGTYVVLIEAAELVADDQ